MQSYSVMQYNIQKSYSSVTIYAVIKIVRRLTLDKSIYILPYIHRSLNILHTKYLLLLSILMYVSMIVKRPSRLGLHLYCLHLRFISTSWKKGGVEYDEYCRLERILSTLSHNDSTYSIISLDILYSIVLCILYMY